jgi:hypothetical protein
MVKRSMGDLRFGIHSLDDLVSGFRGRTKFKNPICQAARQMGHPQIQRLKSRATRPTVKSQVRLLDESAWVSGSS